MAGARRGRGRQPPGGGSGGGHLVDGYPISPLDPGGVRRFLDELDGRFDAVAVCRIFGPSFPDQELEVAALVHDHLGIDVPVSLSHEVGALGLLECENATVLNAALHRVAREATSALVTVVDEEGLDAASFFAQNDGTLMALDYAARHPCSPSAPGPRTRSAAPPGSPAPTPRSSWTSAAPPATSVF